MITGSCIVIMGPRNLNTGPCNLIRGLQYDYGTVQSDCGTV